MSIRYTVRGGVGDVSLSLIKGYGLTFFFCSKFLPFHSPSLYRDSPLLYSLHEVIRTLHLLIIWTYT